MTQPTGGPKDEVPPLLLASQPTNESTSFNGNTISLTFDEYIALNNYKEQLLVTPRLQEEFEAVVKRKTVFLKLNEKLQDNTTYTFNFRDAIEDITEGNPALNLKLAVSTGSYIDSSFIEGKVVHLMKQEPFPGAMIGAYFAHDTLNILNTPPSYMTISDKEGSFRLDNLKPGSYKLYALNDGNKNSMLDFKTETFGLLSDTIQLDTSVSQLQIPLFYNDQRPLSLTSARTSGKYFIAKYNKYVSDIAIESNPDDSITYRFEDENKSIKFYNTLASDSTELFITVFDTLGISQLDTIQLKFTESPRSPDDYTFVNKPQPQPLSSHLVKTTLQFSKPSRRLNSDSLFIFLDSANLLYVHDSTLHWDKTRSNVELLVSLESHWHDSIELKNIRLVVGNNAFISVENDSSYSFSARINFTEPSRTGIIEVQVKTERIGYTIQLLDQSFNVLQQVENRSEFSFSHLTPGNYMLRALIDNNGNGRWDPGDIFNNTEPEEVFLYRTSEGSSTLTLKANWVLGPNVLTF